MTNDQTDKAAHPAPRVPPDDSLQSSVPVSVRVPGHHLTRTGILPQLCISPAQMWDMTAQAAYYRAQQRGFAPGHELDDWLAAEEEVLSNLM